MGTTNYDFTYLEPNNPIDLVGDTTTFLDEIDATIKDVADNVPQFDPTQLESEIADLNADVVLLQSADNSMSNDITNLQNSVTNINMRFPIQTSQIAAGAVTFDKIAQSAVSGVLSTINIRHFDSSDSLADNGNMTIPSGCAMAGYYITEWMLLVITRWEKPAGLDINSWTTGNTGFRLPNYIPRVTAGGGFASGRKLSSAGVINENGTDSSIFDGWTGFGINIDGTVGPNSPKLNSHQYLCGNIVAFLGPLGANS